MQGGINGNGFAKAIYSSLILTPFSSKRGFLFSSSCMK
jgi:hypothetical protein